MSLLELEEKCLAVLDDETLDEDDRVDKVEELVRQRYPNMAPKRHQKIAMDFMWKHKDPERSNRPTVHIVNVSEVETNVDIPDLERRLQLERQFLELDALNQASQASRASKQGRQPTQSLLQGPEEKSLEDKAYQDLLNKTNELKQELYGDRERPLAMANSSPINHISAFFNDSVPKTRINQALKSTGYSVLNAVQLLISQLKQETQKTQEIPERTSIPAPYTSVIHSNYTGSQLFLDPGKKTNAICSFLLRHGKCLRSDCQFSHDIEQRVCAFWLNGHCFAGDNCPLKHSLDDLQGHDGQYELEPVAQQGLGISSEEQFPPLSSSSLVSKTSTKASSTKSKKFNAGSASSFTPSSFSSANVHAVPAFNVSSSHPPPVIEPYSPAPPQPPTVYKTSSAISIVKPLRRPKLIPWEATDNEHLKNYLLHRNNAIKFENQRKKFAQISTDSWKSNDGARSKQMSDKANKFEQKCFDALKLADDELYNYSESTHDEVWFEFHGLEFNEALEQLDSSLKEVKAKSKNQTKIVYLTVPAMTYDHNGYKKTTKPISLWLDHEGYRWQLYGSGNGHYGSIIAIDPWLK